MIRPLHAILVALPVLTIISSAQSAAPSAQSATRLSVRLAEAPGAEQPAPVAGWTETWTKPRPLRLYFLRVDLQDSRIEPCVLLGIDPDGPGPAEAALTTPGQLADREPGLLAAVNANAFAHLPTATAHERARGWFAGKAVDIEGLAAAGGSVRSPSQEGRVPFWFDRSGRPHLGAPSPEQPLHHGVADWGDLLVNGGENVAKPSSALHPRTLAGFDATGRWLWLVVVDGRRRGVSEGISLPEAAVLMLSRSCAEAVNLDGGGSSIMLQHDAAKPGLTIINQPSDGKPRAIPVMLGIRHKPAPDKNPAPTR